MFIYKCSETETWLPIKVWLYIFYKTGTTPPLQPLQYTYTPSSQTYVCSANTLFQSLISKWIRNSKKTESLPRIHGRIASIMSVKVQSLYSKFIFTCNQLLARLYRAYKPAICCKLYIFELPNNSYFEMEKKKPKLCMALPSKTMATVKDLQIKT